MKKSSRSSENWSARKKEEKLRSDLAVLLGAILDLDDRDYQPVHCSRSDDDNRERLINTLVQNAVEDFLSEHKDESAIIFRFFRLVVEKNSTENGSVIPAFGFSFYLEFNRYVKEHMKNQEVLEALRNTGANCGFVLREEAQKRYRIVVK